MSPFILFELLTKLYPRDQQTINGGTSGTGYVLRIFTRKGLYHKPSKLETHCDL
jgi:hypothetical protein